MFILISFVKGIPNPMIIYPIWWRTCIMYSFALAQPSHSKIQKQNHLKKVGTKITCLPCLTTFDSLPFQKSSLKFSSSHPLSLLASNSLLFLIPRSSALLPCLLLVHATMPTHDDTNPHFVRPFQLQGPDQYPQTPPVGPFLQQPQHQGQHSGPVSLGPGWTEPPPDVKPARRHRQKHSGRHSRPLGPLVSFHPRFQDQHPHPQPNHSGQQTQPLVPPVPIANQDNEDPQPPAKRQSQQTLPLSSHDTQGQPHHGQRPHPHGLLRPHTQQTNLFQWSLAIFCAIFWVIIIIGGLVVLIVYLIFRPRTPKFDVSTATLNAAYLDMGYLLNADVTVLANFTNPNKKVSVDFSSLIIDLYYGNTLIATQYIEPFSAHKRESMFANVHMVVSQVRLGLLESQRLQKQMETNRAVFEVKGSFRARANFGNILRYSYWLHGDCKVVFTRPPDGVLVSRKCKTKH
ncbi:unnamed protein product [Prunus brigantina]